jgi:hypothetical protein
MDRRHRSGPTRIARLCAVVAVAVVGAGIVIGGPVLPAAAAAAAVAAVVAAVAAVRLERAARADLARQRAALDAELDQRLARLHDAQDGVLAALRGRLRQAGRDRDQLEMALQMALLRRDGGDRRTASEGSGVHGVELDTVRRDVSGVRLDRAS